MSKVLTQKTTFEGVLLLYFYLVLYLWSLVSRIVSGLLSSLYTSERSLDAINIYFHQILHGA